MTVATLRRISGEVSDIGVPSTSMVPSSGRSAPTRQRSRVDLPAPLRPVRAMASPARTSRLNPSKMVWGPKARFSPDTLSTVVRLAMRAILPPRASGSRPRPPSPRSTRRRRTAPSGGAAADYASADWQAETGFRDQPGVAHGDLGRIPVPHRFEGRRLRLVVHRVDHAHRELLGLVGRQPLGLLGRTSTARPRSPASTACPRRLRAPRSGCSPRWAWSRVSSRRSRPTGLRKRRAAVDADGAVVGVLPVCSPPQPVRARVAAVMPAARVNARRRFI